MKTVTRAAIAVLAGLAIIGDAFLLFIKPHLAQQAGTTGSALASNGTTSSGNGSSANAQSESSTDSNSANSTDSNDSTNSNDSTDSADSSNTESTDSNTLKDGTYTSVASPNAYGEIQLQVTVAGGKITTITTVKAPTHGRSQSVNAQALPMLTERAISAQSADIQFVSGATETSTAFVNSLQDAINQSLNAAK
ncbi:FMN-binding protein [Bifidobacterium reuteri]|uniref:FMN-binding domain-containing protein n=2 Tax=Bifidobacterium reuteri TaxID=983706 RepID=A0A087CM91_9BIFI|nr:MULTISPECIES: FMN-binding protein [Bifidobacterium]KAA8825513.1 FMN-binding protein [Bifidobacterium reuteri]KFI84391.1 FMN-binding domain-containing protein [Bifidobacterium reuteri DSM 23975]TPF77753.1 hypothetical protein BW09_07930 [Bifidobacterium sp. UTCIF-1]TPF80240.1 hypothetical protein BW08_05635 [Bifidobacterium sp. UTCIF-24]TPF83062.1 hypothetical protein BW12_01735 [Bifidobacterium sp. UTCIF-3]